MIRRRSLMIFASMLYRKEKALAPVLRDTRANDEKYILNGIIKEILPHRNEK